MNFLFVCTAGSRRSKTAAGIYNGKYSSLYNLTEELVKWADKIFVFEKYHVYFISEKFPKYKNKITNLDISNDYSYNSPELIESIKNRMKNFVK